MEGKRLETVVRNWAKVMGLMPNGNASEVFRKLCSNERKVVWKRVVREIHPIYEVEHIRKHLAFKKMSEKVKLRQKLAEKEEEIHIREHDLEQAHMKLKVLNCQMQAIKQRMKDLGMKTLILRFKKHELENEATRLEELCQVANFFRQPVESGCGDPHSSCTKHVETACENAIYECKAQILELHKLYKMKDVNMQILHSKKESVMEFVHYRMKDFSILNVWRTLLNSVDQLNKELHNLTQSNVRMESEHMHAVKECIDSEMKKFMKSYVELFAAYHGLQHKMKQCSSDCDILFDRTVEMLQEEWRGYKFGDVFQECGRIRQWLELQSKFTEFGIINEVLQNEIKNLKVNTYSTDLDILNLQEEEIKRLGNEIETLRADLRTNSLWLTKSHAGQIETAEKLKQEITKLSQTCALDKCGMTTLDASVKGLRGAFQHELKEFMALPIHLLDNIALPSGSVLPSNQQILKYHNNLMNVDQLHGLTGILTALEGAPSAAPHGITLQLLEKTLYLSFLNSTEMNSNELNSSLAVLDISSKENAATTAVTEVMKVAEKSIEECKIIAERAKANYRTWLEHPLRHAVPESLQIDEKNFQQWQREYDSLLASLIDLESEEEVSYMV